MTVADRLQTQPMLRVAVAFITGIVVGDYVSADVAVWWWIAGAAALLLIILALRSKFPVCQSACIFAGIFCTGAALATIADQRMEYPFQGEEPLHYQAVITDAPKVRGRTLQCDMAILSVGGRLLDKPINIKAAILRDTVNGDWKRLHTGSGIEAFSVMQPLESIYQDSNFDYTRWLHVHGFTAQTFIYYSDWQKTRISLKSLSTYEILKLKALRLRAKLTSFLYANGYNDDQESAVIAAMVLGDKHAISKETKEVYSISGGSHVLALSGLHLGIIYTLLTLLFGRWRRRWLCQLLVLAAIWTYVVIVGMGASVMRSAVMLTIYSLCLVMRRDKASVNTLALAAICLLAANPLALWDVGFQMSFMAVLTIVVFYKPIYHLLPIQNRLLKTIWGMAVVSLTAQIGTAPLVAYYFGRFSCYFLLTNFIVVPAAMAIIYGTIALFLSSPIPVLCSAMAKALGFIAWLLNTSLSWIASLPGASIENIHVSKWQVVLTYIIIMCIYVALVFFTRSMRIERLDAFTEKKKKSCQKT